MTVQEPREENGRWWSRRWRQLLTDRGIESGSQTPRKPARIKRLEVMPGLVVAAVHAQSGDLCTVEIRIPTWTDSEWKRALETLGQQALYTAHLLSGELPPDLETALSHAGVSLLPTPHEEIDQTCSCCGKTDAPCDHMIAAFRALGDMLVDDPWLLLRLRGRDQQQVLRSLRMRRQRSGDPPDAPSRTAPGLGPQPQDRNPNAAGDHSPHAAAHGPVDSPEPLEAAVAAFWGSARAQEAFRPFIVPPAVELALLRRLGAPPSTGASSDSAASIAYDKLAEIYREVSRAALALAYAADPVPDDTGRDDTPS